MNPAGRLRIDVTWDGHTVVAVDIASTRPPASRLLVGKPVEEALRIVPLLFSICGKAQGIAAQAAWQAARGASADPAATRSSELVVAAEAAQEHLWRLLVDWPQLLGLSPQRETLAVWHRHIAAAQTRGGWQTLGVALLRMIETEIIAQPFAAWEQWLAAAVAEREVARGAGEGLAGLMLGVLRGAEWRAPGARRAPACLPMLPAAALVQQGDSRLDERFAACPGWRGEPAETGGLARRQRLPRVAALIASGHLLAARLLARMVDLIDCARRLAAPDMAAQRPPLVDACRIAEHAAVAQVETARGKLLHCIHEADGHVERYVIVAPTEWNFRPDGALHNEIVGAVAGSETAMRRYLQGLVLALDPCVECEVKLHHA